MVFISKQDFPFIQKKNSINPEIRVKNTLQKVDHRKKKPVNVGHNEKISTRRVMANDHNVRVLSLLLKIFPQRSFFANLKEHICHTQ